MRDPSWGGIRDRWEHGRGWGRAGGARACGWCAGGWGFGNGGSRAPGCLDTLGAIGPAPGRTVTGGAQAAPARFGHAGATRSAAGLQRGELAGFPEHEHPLQAGKEARQAGQNQGVQRLQQPAPLGASCVRGARRGAMRFHSLV